MPPRLASLLVLPATSVCFTRTWPLLYVPALRVKLLPLPVDRLRNEDAVDLPPLIKGYLRLGAKVLGPPAWDPDFNSADLPMLMRIGDLPARYRKHFLGA